MCELTFGYRSIRRCRQDRARGKSREMASRATAMPERGAAAWPDRAVRHQVVLIRIDDWIGALPIGRVDQVLPAVAVHAASRSAGDLIGHVNVHGTIVPVADAQAILGLRRRPISLTDHLVLTSTSGGPVIVPVNAAIGVAAVLDEATGEPAALHPVKTERLGEPVVTLIDPDRVFGHIARRGTEADTRL